MTKETLLITYIITGENMAAEELFASLRFVGSPMPSGLITKELNLNPSRTWQKGAPFVDPSGRILRRYNGLWLYDAKEVKSKLPVEHIRQLMGRINGHLQHCLWECRGKVKADLCLWIAASEFLWSIDGEDVDLMLLGGYDGFNVTFIGIDDASSNNHQEIGEEKLCPRVSCMLISCDNDQVVCTLSRKGRSAENIECALALFVRKLRTIKKTLKCSSMNRICIEWDISHGAIYFSNSDLKWLRDVGCSRIDFAFRNI